MTTRLTTPEETKVQAGAREWPPVSWHMSRSLRPESSPAAKDWQGWEQNPEVQLWEQTLAPTSIPDGSSQDMPHTGRHFQLLKGQGPGGPGKQQGVGRAPQLFLRNPQVLWTREGWGSCGPSGDSLCPAPAGGARLGGGGSHLTAVREDDHHAAVQSLVVLPRQLCQSLEHLLQEGMDCR